MTESVTLVTNARPPAAPLASSGTAGPEGLAAQSSFLIDTTLYWGTKIATAVAILLAAWMIGKWLQRKIARAKRIDETLTSFFGGFVKYTVMMIGVIMTLGQFGVQTASLLAVLGGAALAIGLALQGTLSNVAAGMMLLILRPFKVGDTITAGGVMARVTTLGIFGTDMITPDGVHIFMPNNKIWNAEILNYSSPDMRRQSFFFQLGYSGNVDQALRLINGIIEADSRILKGGEAAPLLVVNALGEFSVEIMAELWTRPADMAGVKNDLNRQVKEALEAAGIGMAATRTLRIAGNPDNNKGEEDGVRQADEAAQAANASSGKKSNGHPPGQPSR